MMQAPQVWINGRQVTGYASDRAPVLAPLTLTWGTDTAIDQPPPSNLKLTILFRDGMDDIPDLNKGSQIELVHPAPKRTIFAGLVRTMSAIPSERISGGLEVSLNATSYKAEAENEFISTDWIDGNTRHLRLVTAFFDAGYRLQLPRDPRPSEASRYNSIKLMTLLERFTSRYRGRHFDTSYRTETGVLIKRISVIKGHQLSTRSDTLEVTPDGQWTRRVRPPITDSVASPLVTLDGSNVLLNPEWTQDSTATITAVQLSNQVMGDDGFTTLQEHNYRAPSGVVKEFGLQSVDIETDVQEPSQWPEVAKQWMNDDSPWQMSGLEIRDASLLDTSTLVSLLDPASRNSTLVYVTNILANRPDPGPSIMRSYIMGGEYTWTGEEWKLTLTLERVIYGKPAALTRFVDIRDSSNPGISLARLQDIGHNLTFADFREIERPN